MVERIFNERYRLDDRIGEGGMATVFSGMDTLLRRRVAIKVLRSQYAADQDFVRRFYIEAQHAAKLSHPNIVNIYDVGRQDDTYFIVMELVEGATLAEMIESDQRLPEPVAIDYAAQICNGLAYAHRQGLLHRDIKPANILVTKDDIVKLSDFGIARAVSQQAMGVTQPGMVMGSAYYLSPEQAQGHELHETSDLYSLGVVLYQMLTGRLPYTGDSPITVAIKHVSAPVPTLDEGSVSPALAAIVRKLLQKDPAKRFSSATETASMLREAREHPLQAYGLETSSDLPAASEGWTRPIERLQIPQPPPRPSPFPDTRPVDAADAPKASAPPPIALPQPAPTSTRRIVLPAFAAALLLGALVAGWEVVGQGLFRSHAPVRVANYVGMQQEAARSALSTLGLQARILDEPSESIARDLVISQQPTPGSTLAPPSFVDLVVSSGLPIVELTDLHAFSREDAERFLRNAKLAAKFTEKYDKAPRGTIIDQAPSAGTHLPVHSLVMLTVSKGLSPVSVPDIVSLTLDNAAKVLQTRNLSVNITDREPSDDIPENVVASQDPKPGAHVDPGTQIDVVISTGPATLTVPDVAGRNLDEAQSIVKGVDLSPHIVYLVQPDTPPGTIIDQTPPALAAARRGQMITLTIAVPGTVPNVAGMPLEQAKSVLAACGYTVGNVAYTQEGMDGRVVRTEPEAGASLRPGEAVTMYYNNAFESR